MPVLEVTLQFSDMAAGDFGPFSFDFISPIPPNTFGWTTADDPVVSAAVWTSAPTELQIIGAPRIDSSIVSAWVSGGCQNTEYKIHCTAVTQFGRKATRTGYVYVDRILPG